MSQPEGLVCPALGSPGGRCCLAMRFPPFSVCCRRFFASVWLWLLPPMRVAQSVVGAVAIDAILALNHRPGRYLGV